MMNKNNVPYYIAGTLATFTLLASGVFAAAPYAQFLAPVAALSVGLPFIIGCAVFSVVTIALSYKAISKNKTISEKDAQLAKKVEEISKKDAQLAKGEDKVQAQEKENSEQKIKIDQQNTEISRKKESKGEEIVEDSSASRLAKAAVAGAMATGGVAGAVLGGIAGGMAGCTLGPVMLGLYVDKSIVFTTKKEDEVYELAKGILDSVGSGVKKVYNAMPSIESAKGTLGSGVKSIYDTSVGYTMETLNAAGSGVKKVYNAVPSIESARNWVPSLKTAGWIAGGVGLLVVTTYTTVNGGLSIAGNSFNVAGNSTNGTESDASISNSSSVYYKPTDQQIKQSQIHEINKTLADTNKGCEDNYGTPKEDSLSNLASGSNKGAHDRSEPQWHKDLYKLETMEKIMDGNLFSPRVDNGINTSKQQGAFIDSVELKRLTKELPLSAHPNGSPRAL